MKFGPMNNGTIPDEQDLEVAEALQARIASLTEEKERLEAELEQITPRLRRYERALTMLTAAEEPPRPGRKPKSEGQRVRATPSKVGPEMLAEIQAFVLDYARDHEEFRQVDIRTAEGTPVKDSGKLSSAFEQLRQSNVIRFARQQGNAKYFRLTRETIGAMSDEQQ